MSTPDQLASEGARQVVHHVEGFVITEEHYWDMQGQLLCDCVITGPFGRFVHRYSKLEDALSFVRAVSEAERIRDERRQQQQEEHDRKFEAACKSLDDENKRGIATHGMIAPQRDSKMDGPYEKRVEFAAVEHPEDARSRCPWATIVWPFEGGFICFEAARDFDYWRTTFC
jgi:hypothetical protein